MAQDPQTPKPAWFEDDAPTVPTSGPVVLYTVQLVRTLVQHSALSVPLPEGLSDTQVLEAVNQLPLAMPEGDWSPTEVAAVAAVRCLQRRQRK